MSEFVRIIDPSGKTIRNDLYNSPPDAASYIIFKDGDLIKAKNGRTGQVEFSGADAATVIQQAIDALPNGGLIFFRKSNYPITSKIEINNNHIVLACEYSTILRKAVNDCILKVNADYVTIQGLWFDGNKESYTGNNIYITSLPSYWKVINVRVYNAQSSGIFVERGGYGEIRNSLFIDNNAYGIRCYKLTKTSKVTIRDNVLLNNGVTHIHVERFDSAEISGNFASTSNYAGIYVYELNNVKVTNNWSMFNGHHGFELTLVEHAEIIGNHAINNNQAGGGHAGIYLGDSKYCIVIGNHAIDTQSTPTQGYGIKEDGELADYNIIRLNYVSGNVVQQISKVGAHTIVRDNLGFVTENSGTATFSGDGTTDDFNIGAHGLAVTDPNRIVVKVTPISSDAIAASPCVGYVDPADNTKIRVKFASPPASGTDNVKIIWEAQVVP